MDFVRYRWVHLDQNWAKIDWWSWKPKMRHGCIQTCSWCDEVPDPRTIAVFGLLVISNSWTLQSRWNVQPHWRPQKIVTLTYVFGWADFFSWRRCYDTYDNTHQQQHRIVTQFRPSFQAIEVPSQFRQLKCTQYWSENHKWLWPTKIQLHKSIKTSWVQHQSFKSG